MNFKPLTLTVIFGIIILVPSIFVGITRSDFPPSPDGEYSPWGDLNDDGIIDLFDIVWIAGRYDTTGTAINKTELVSLQSTLSTQIFQSGLLLHLPCGATTHYGGIDYSGILHSLDVDQSKPGDQQTISVYKGTPITITGEHQRFQGAGGSGAILQAFLIYSWTPSWPPPSSAYYHVLYNGGAGPYPGTGIQSFSFNLTVPDNPGTYYLYYCAEAQFGMIDAVNKYSTPLYVPYAIITVVY
jgi:hypothetical protein